MRQRRERTIVQEEKLQSLTEQMEARVDSDVIDEADEYPVHIFLPTGLAILNCSLSDRVNGGWPGGRISQIIGPSDLGKSAFGTTALAEASQNPVFDSYRLIDMDIEHARSQKTLFGQCYRERVEHWVTGSDSFPAPATVEELHYFLLEIVKSGKPFVALVDSVDFLPSKQALDETEEHFKKWQGNKVDKAGSYNMAKQKYIKKMLGEMKGLIGKTDSILILVSQIIDNVGAGLFEQKTVATGGHSVEFACRVRGWLKSTGEVEKVRDRIIGRQGLFQIKKNHITFKKRDVEYWIFEGRGIDDIRSTVDFLIKEKFWTKDGAGRVSAPEIAQDQKLTVKELVRYIDKEDLSGKLNRCLQRAWNKIEKEIEETISRDRKSRYL